MEEKILKTLEKILREIQDIKVVVQEDGKEKNVERILREVEDIKVLVQDNN